MENGLPLKTEVQRNRGCLICWFSGNFQIHVSELIQGDPRNTRGSSKLLQPHWRSLSQPRHWVFQSQGFLPVHPTSSLLNLHLDELLRESHSTLSHPAMLSPYPPWTWGRETRRRRVPAEWRQDNESWVTGWENQQLIILNQEGICCKKRTLSGVVSLII